MAYPQDIGRQDNMPIDIKRIDELLAKFDVLSGKLDEAIAELNKIKEGTGFVTGTDLEEAVR